MNKAIRTLLFLFLLVGIEALTTARAQVRVLAPRKSGNGLEVTITGNSSSSVTLQGSSDGRTWSNLQTFSTLAGSAAFVDSIGSGKVRFYRAKINGGTVNPPVINTLPDLANSVNAVFHPGEGVDSVQYAPNGNLGFIFWKDRNLVLRERSGAGWVEQVVSTGGGIGLQSLTERVFSSTQPAAVLLYDSNSNPNIFKVSGGAAIGHFTRSGTTWRQSGSLNANGASGGIYSLVGAVGPNNAFHLATLGTGGSPNIVYGSNKGGSWTWSTVASLGSDQTWNPGSYQRRHFAMAVDSRNSAHIVYRPSITYTSHPQGYKRAYSELNYANNTSGSWRSETVTKPTDAHAESGAGASIAVAPGDKPAIVNWFNDRGEGGSASWSRLHYWTKDGSGTWGASIVASRPDTYIAGDGEKGTGAIPYLRFDGLGRPHILFLDHAAEHFPFQNEYAGNLRHAWWTGSQWQNERVLLQTKPLLEQIVYTGFALRGNEMAVTALQRLTLWNTAVNPQVSANSYKFSVLTKAIQ